MQPVTLQQTLERAYIHRRVSGRGTAQTGARRAMTTEEAKQSLQRDYPAATLQQYVQAIVQGEEAVQRGIRARRSGDARTLGDLYGAEGAAPETIWVRFVVYGQDQYGRAHQLDHYVALAPHHTIGDVEAAAREYLDRLRESGTDWSFEGYRILALQG